MHATKVSDLLPISDDDKHPHAYQVFGLEGGEQDHRKIKAAISATVKKLKEQKSDADPKVWKQAAKLVQQAEVILSDPQKRVELDAMFGVVHVAETSTDLPNHSSEGTRKLRSVGRHSAVVGSIGRRSSRTESDFKFASGESTCRCDTDSVA